MKHKAEKIKHWFSGKRLWTQVTLAAVTSLLFISGLMLLWVATLKIPDLESFEDRILSGSTKIYDKTGDILLYDVNQEVKRQVVPFSEISQYMKNAVIAIEDDQFYQHSGVRPLSFLRAVIVNLTSGEFKQGGSTITQQVIKNSLLTTDKKISRKIKEWVLALKLERVMSKDDILNLYLNGTPWGGPMYGIEEATQTFFGKTARDLTIAESAYLAAIPKAPTYYSPFGSHTDKLEARKNLVLSKMKENGFISETEYQNAKNEKVVFRKQENRNIKAPHFVMYIKEYLVDTYGEDMLKNGNLKVITTLDYELQVAAEEIVKRKALENVKKFNAENAALIAVDPTTGHIITMVGSRDYFDKEIEGNFNVTLAHRQPGSSFKPFVYATAFTKGYTPDTVLMDTKTEFSTTCNADGTPKYPGATCYQPDNYDNQFVGPISLRNALAQSRNIPAIKLLYLSGMRDTLRTTSDLGITSLNDPDRYGLTMVLGGGEVSPLEMTSAYSVFANNGIRNPHTGIIKVTDRNGKVLEEFKPTPIEAIPEQTALNINNVLSDNNARMPLNGAGTPTDFPNAEVALKTGTTNDYRDAWIIGYTPHIAVGAWAGNNDNSPMIKKTSGAIIAPIWREFMDVAMKKNPATPFKRPDPVDQTLPPILRGDYVNGSSDGVHTILYWIDKTNPKGPRPSNPQSDSQFDLWESGVRNWAFQNGQASNPGTPGQTVGTETFKFSIDNPINGTTYDETDYMAITLNYQSQHPITKAEAHINGVLHYTTTSSPYTMSFELKSIQNLRTGGSQNDLKVILYDNQNNKVEANQVFTVR